MAVGGLVLLALWAAAGFAPDFGWDCVWAGGWLVGILAAGSLLHYPWGPEHCKALGAKYADRRGT